MSRWLGNGEMTGSHGGIVRGEALSYERAKKHDCLDSELRKRKKAGACTPQYRDVWLTQELFLRQRMKLRWYLDFRAGPRLDLGGLC